MFYHDVQPDLVKFARFWITLATSVSFLDVFSSGYSEHRKKQIKLLKYKTLCVCVCVRGGGGGEGRGGGEGHLGKVGIGWVRGWLGR